MLIELKFALIKRRLSQRELARRIGATDAQVSQVIHSRRKPRVGDRRRISRVLRMPVRKLFPAIRRRRRIPAKKGKV